MNPIDSQEVSSNYNTNPVKKKNDYLKPTYESQMQKPNDMNKPAYKPPKAQKKTPNTQYKPPDPSWRIPKYTLPKVPKPSFIRKPRKSLLPSKGSIWANIKKIADKVRSPFDMIGKYLYVCTFNGKI